MENLKFLSSLAIAKTQIKREFVYRFDYIVWALVIPSWIVMDYFLWKAVYAFAGQTVIRGMTFELLISYFVASMAMGVLTNAEFDDWVADKIRTGKLIKFMNYPVNFVQFLFFKWAGGRVLTIPVFVAPLFLLGYFLVGFNILEANLILLSLSFVLAAVLVFLFALLFALVAFWFKNIKGVKLLRQGIVWFMGGAVVPLNFFPAWFQEISNYLPFQYMRYIPAQIMIGSELVSTNAIFSQFIWVIIMVCIAALAWNQAYKQFTGAGV